MLRMIDLRTAQHHHSHRCSLTSSRPAYDDISHADRSLRYMNPPAPIQYTQTKPHHGIKRSAPTDEIESSSNISTEFKKLRLNNALPVASTKSTNCGIDGYDASSLEGMQVPLHDQNPVISHVSAVVPQNSLPASHQSHSDDSMTVDETPHRVYISDLDREIAEIEAAESLHSATNGSFFLPDVDKNISKIPLNVLRQKFDSASSAPGPSRSASEQALVLYRDPSSISVPEEEDAVRKAIIASRRNAREKIRQEHVRKLDVDGEFTNAGGMGFVDHGTMQDEDQMDIE